VSNAHQHRHLRILFHLLVSISYLISKRYRKRFTKFVLPRFKNNVVSFLNIYRKHITFQSNVKIAQCLIKSTKQITHKFANDTEMFATTVICMRTGLKPDAFQAHRRFSFNGIFFYLIDEITTISFSQPLLKSVSSSDAELRR